MSNDGEQSEDQITKSIEEIKFNYIKSQFFRVIHVDGIYGGVNTNLDIHVAVFNERSPIPKESIYRVKEDGSLGDEILEKRISRDGIIREVESDLIMDLSTAQALVKWLQEKIELTKKILEERRKKKVKNGSRGL